MDANSGWIASWAHALRIEDKLAERGEAIVAAARVVVGRRWPPRLGLLHKAFDRAVERWGPEAHLAGGAVEDVLHDAVAVLFSAGEGEHDVEPLRFKGEEG
jgi:hypothetical protein